MKPATTNCLGKACYDELNTIGWTTCEFDGQDESLLRIACSLGRPIAPRSNHPVIRWLTPQHADPVSGKTFSKIFGTGSFPLHTDTAHWPLPARYLLLADVGTSHDRPTLLLEQGDFLAELDAGEVGHSVWKAPGPRGNFLCSLIFHESENTGIRFDPLCMQPQNAAAQKVAAAIANMKPNAIRINWQRHLILVIDNWRVLHGRGWCSVDDTGTRLMKRILVNNAERN